MTKQEELGSSLQKLLSALKKNREMVGVEILKTHYQKPYEELICRINQSATAYVKEVTLRNLLINPDISLDEQIQLINQTISDSGLLKEMGRSISRQYDVYALHQLAQTLRRQIEDALSTLS